MLLAAVILSFALLGVLCALGGVTTPGRLRGRPAGQLFRKAVRSMVCVTGARGLLGRTARAAWRRRNESPRATVEEVTNEPRADLTRYARGSIA